MVVVRPAKLPAQTMISARSSATPLTLYAHLRAALIAVSTASAPVFHRQRLVEPGDLADPRQERTQAIGVKGTRRHRQRRRLVDQYAQAAPGWHAEA
jgi:hypothetical protein